MDPWYAVTLLGSPEIWASLSAGMVIAYLLLRQTRWKSPSPQRRAFKKAAALLALSLILAFVSVQAIKLVTQVPRPCFPCSEGLEALESLESVECNPYCETDPSFPSGHAATIFAVVTLPLLMARRKGLLLLYLLAGLVAYSRLALGVHTLTDIVAGSFIGLISALVIWKIMASRVFCKEAKGINIGHA